MTDREAMQQALEALDRVMSHGSAVQEAKDILRERLAQPETTIDKSAATRIATALGWVPPGDTSTERVDETAKQRQEQEPVAKWDASAPLVVTPHPAFQATPQRREWVGLTDEEQTQVAWSCGAMSADWLDFARAIEAKLREKNT